MRMRRPSTALVVAIVALVVAVGGTSYAAITVTGANIRNGSVQSIDLTDNAILSRDIRNGGIFPVDLSAAAKSALKGATGATGPTGSTGPTGPTGPAGTHVPVTVLGSVDVAAGTHLVSLYCFEGTVAMSAKRPTISVIATAT